MEKDCGIFEIFYCYNCNEVIEVFQPVYMANSHPFCTKNCRREYCMKNNNTYYSPNNKVYTKTSDKNKYCRIIHNAKLATRSKTI